MKPVIIKKGGKKSIERLSCLLNGSVRTYKLVLSLFLKSIMSYLVIKVTREIIVPRML